MELQQAVWVDFWGDGLVDGGPSTGECDGSILHVGVLAWNVLFVMWLGFGAQILFGALCWHWPLGGALGEKFVGAAGGHF
jgi:phage gp37-like protein